MKIFLKISLLIIILVFLGLFVRATDWSGVIASIQQVGFNFLILLVTTFASAWLGSLGWHYCLPKDGVQISGWRLFWIRMVGENVAILNPTSIVGGEATKIYLLTNHGISQRSALHSILLSRAITILSQLLMLSVAGVWFVSLSVEDYTPYSHYGWWLVAVLGMMAVLLALPSIRVFRNLLRLIFHHLRILHQLLKARLFLLELWQELRVFYRDNRRGMFLSFLACSLHWIVGSLEFYFILLFLGIKTTIAKALLVDMGVIVFKTIGGFIPAQIGIEEYGNKTMLAIIGITGNTIWITASILRRARQLSWIILGFLMYFIYFYRRPTPPQL
jgi:uncharacterized membrane protein YbhN (UPF0104 family)